MSAQSVSRPAGQGVAEQHSPICPRRQMGCMAHCGHCDHAITPRPDACSPPLPTRCQESRTTPGEIANLTSRSDSLPFDHWRSYWTDPSVSFGFHCCTPYTLTLTHAPPSVLAWIPSHQHTHTHTHTQTHPRPPTLPPIPSSHWHSCCCCCWRVCLALGRCIDTVVTARTLPTPWRLVLVLVPAPGPVPCPCSFSFLCSHPHPPRLFRCCTTHSSHSHTVSHLRTQVQVNQSSFTFLLPVT